jgi:exopolysaccharide biosynthesis predicted pyruvyltransferase EpsI
MLPGWEDERDRFLSRMDRELTRILDPLLPRGVRCALLDFPDHANVGDNAIWLGERAYLRRIEASVVYACDILTYSEAQLARRLEDGIILLSGGGNLGDLWPAYQQFREKVITAFSHNRIIQLPQSIWFREEANRERARAVFDAHPRLTLLVREERSLEFARAHFRTQSLLCPDPSLALGALSRRQAPGQDVLWLLRSDVESRSQGAARIGPEAVDWRADRPSWRSRVNRILSRQRSSHPSANRWTWPVVAPLHGRVWDGLAEERLRRGCALLSRGRVVVTDRLHGHLLSVLLGIPHVLLDNSYGKVRSYYETWTRNCGLAFWAHTPEEASGLARGLVPREGARETAPPAGWSP